MPGFVNGRVCNETAPGKLPIFHSELGECGLVLSQEESNVGFVNVAAATYRVARSGKTHGYHPLIQGRISVRRNENCNLNPSGGLLKRPVRHAVNQSNTADTGVSKWSTKGCPVDLGLSFRPAINDQLWQTLPPQ